MSTFLHWFFFAVGVTAFFVFGYRAVREMLRQGRGDRS